MKHITRIARTIAAVVAALLAVGLTPTAATAAKPAVRATALGSYCETYDGAYYEFQVTNTGDRGRHVSGRIQWPGQGYGETFNLHIGPGHSRIETVRVHKTQRAVITLRAQGKVLIRARLTGLACSKPTA